MRKFCAFFALAALLMALPLQAGTIHEVASQNFSQTASLAATDLLTPPGADSSYTIQVYVEMPSSTSTDSVCAKVRWTDNDGVEQTSGASAAKDPLAQDACAGVASNTAGKRIFPILLKASQHATIETTSTNTIPYVLRVQVIGY